MPRRAPPPVAVAPVNTLLPPPPPSPLVQKLRQDYRWASISQFCWTFSDAFGLVDWDIDVSLFLYPSDLTSTLYRHLHLGKKYR